MMKWYYAFPVSIAFAVLIAGIQHLLDFKQFGAIVCASMMYQLLNE